MGFDIGSMLSSFGGGQSTQGGFGGVRIGNPGSYGGAPTTTAPGFEQGYQQPGMMDRFGNWMGDGQNKEMLSYVLDQLGSKIAPNNPAAGIGTHLAQGSVASQAAQGEQNKMAEFIKSVLAQLSGKDQPGPTDVKVTMGDDGAPKFSITGIGPAETRTPEQIAAAVPTDTAMAAANAPQSAQKDPAKALLKQFGYIQ